MSFPGGASGKKNPPANAGDIRDSDPIPGSGRSLGGGHSNPLQYSSLEKPWTEVPGGLQFMGSQSVRYDWSDLTRMHDAIFHSLLNVIMVMWLEELLGVSQVTFIYRSSVSNCLFSRVYSLLSKRRLHPPSCSSVNLEALLALFLIVLPICPITSLLPMMDQLLTSLVATPLYRHLELAQSWIHATIPPFVYIPQPQCAF